MWRDIGLDDWLLNLDAEQEIEGILPTVLAMAKNAATAKKESFKSKKAGRKKTNKNDASFKKIPVIYHENQDYLFVPFIEFK